MSRGGYTFGDSELAATRLALVADTFAAPSRAFLEDVRATLDRPPALAVDLGCGPGHTTRLVAEVIGADRTVGLDASSAFLDEARSAGAPTVEYVQHDVTAVPFPTGPAGLVYCRLLLAHLPEPASVVATWMTQVRLGGVLAVDEVEFIHTDHPVLALYEELVVALVASRGALMYAGPVLAGMRSREGWEPGRCRLVEHEVPVADAARMYGMNLPTWRNDPAITGAYAQETVDRLAKDLAALADSTGEPPVRWGLRQALFHRTGQTTQA